MVIRGQPKGGPPPEKTICFSNITAPRMARRPNPAQDNVETKDEVMHMCINYTLSQDIYAAYFLQIFDIYINTSGFKQCSFNSMEKFQDFIYGSCPL